MRISRIALVGALLLGAAACQTDDGSAVGATIPPLAFVRYINAVPDTNNLTVRWVDQLEFSPQTFVNVPFRGLGQGGYQGLEAGARHFRVFTYDPRLSTPTGGLPAVTAQLADTTFNFVAGQYYTILHLGYSRTGQTPAQRVYIMNDALPASNNQVSVRVIHANSMIGNVDIFSTATSTAALSGAPIFANLGFNTTTGYSSFAPAQFSAQTALTGTLISESATAAPAGAAGTSAADPISGATIAGSVLTALAFPPAVDGSVAQAYPTTIANNRVVAVGGITLAAGVWTVADSAGNWNQRAGFCAPVTYRWCKVTVTAGGTTTAQFIVTNNGANTVSTAGDLTAAAAATGRKLYSVQAFNSDVVWISDRQPTRTTTP